MLFLGFSRPERRRASTTRAELSLDFGRTPDSEGAARELDAFAKRAWPLARGNRAASAKELGQVARDLAEGGHGRARRLHAAHETARGVDAVRRNVATRSQAAGAARDEQHHVFHRVRLKGRGGVVELRAVAGFGHEGHRSEE